MRTNSASTDERGSRRPGRAGRWAAAGAAVVTALVAAQAQGHADGLSGRALLRDAGGNQVGVVRFSEGDGNKILVRADLASSLSPGFHGFHVHANSAGRGCLAEASEPASAWFTSVGGHYKEADDEAHGNHAGDLPSLLVHHDGTAHLRFTVDRLDVMELDGKALIVHARPDNFANVPVGTGASQYTPNTSAAVTLTYNTGNAGDRVACGVVELR